MAHQPTHQHQHQNTITFNNTTWRIPTFVFKSFDYNQVFSYFKSLWNRTLPDPISSLRWCLSPTRCLHHLHHIKKNLHLNFDTSNNSTMTSFANAYADYLDAAVQAAEQKGDSATRLNHPRYLQPGYPYLTPPFGRLTTSQLFERVSQHLEAADRAIGQDKALTTSAKKVFSYDPTVLENKALQLKEQGYRFYGLLKNTIRNMMQKFRNLDWIDNPPVPLPINSEYISKFPDPPDIPDDRRQELAYIRMYITFEVLVALLIRTSLLSRMTICRCGPGKNKMVLKTFHSLSADFDNKFRLYAIYWTTDYDTISFCFRSAGDPFDTTGAIDTIDKLCYSTPSCGCSASKENTNNLDEAEAEADAEPGAPKPPPPGSPKLPPTPPETPPPTDISETSEANGYDEVD